MPIKLGAVPSTSDKKDSDGGGEEGAGVGAVEGYEDAGFDIV